MKHTTVRILKKLIILVGIFFAVLSLTVVSGDAAWKFGIISDTQWKGSTDGKNPNGVAVNVITHLNREFIGHGVSFVVALGDMTNYGDVSGIDTAATFRQALYNAGIGFYPLRGNHESSARAAAEFKRVFPQTQTGMNNQTPEDARVTTPYYGLPPANTNTPFCVGRNFKSPSDEFAGLTYSFDYRDARFVMIDQFTPPSGKSHSVMTADDVRFVGVQLSSREPGTHAFVFAHKHLISESHADTLFGSDPSANPDGLQDLYMKYLQDNGVRYHFGGHDHMHNRAIVTSPDGMSTVQDVITASDSNKFYTPHVPPNDEKFNVPAKGILHGPRETMLSRQLYAIGYYIVTVDGPEVTVDYYSSPNGCGGDCNSKDDVIPYTFTKQETFGYALNGKEFVVRRGASYTAVRDHYKTNEARILSGINTGPAMSYEGRVPAKAINTGWKSKKHDGGNDQCLVGDIFTLHGMADLGRKQTDVYVLSLSYNAAQIPKSWIAGGLFGLVARNAGGKWVNAVEMNTGGVKTFVRRPWKSDDPLGTFGVDPTSESVWAVVNFDGEFAVAKVMGPTLH